jgi:5-methylcytosine-specific restriction endonuclease McrA
MKGFEPTEEQIEAHQRRVREGRRGGGVGADKSRSGSRQTPARAAWQKETDAKFKARTRQMYATLKRRAGSQTIPTLDDIRAELNFTFRSEPRCPYCRRNMSVADVSLDHKTPLSRGGLASMGNTQFVCMGCNKSKGNMDDAEYRVLLRKLDEVEAETANFTLKAKILTALRIEQSFRQGAMRRAKKV